MALKLLSFEQSTKALTLIVLADNQASNVPTWANAEFSAQEISLIQDCCTKKIPHLQLSQAQRQVFIHFVGENAPAKNSLEGIRQAGAYLAQQLQHYQIAEAELINRYDGQALSTAALVEGLYLGNYQFLKYHSQAEKKQTKFQTLAVEHQSLTTEALQALSEELEAITWARDLINEPPAQMTALKMAQAFVALGQKGGFSVEVLDKAAIESLGMGGVLGVNQGSSEPPTYTIMEWKPEEPALLGGQPIVLVGKGLTYDTGGLSLKPTPNSMDMMKCDMAGGAVVGALMYLVAKAKLPFHVIGLVPATDNRLDAWSYSPGDVLKMMDGSFVEVLNTDAEGRLILADALHHAKQYQPYMVLDFATLTGSAAMATGTRAAVYYSTAKEALNILLEASAWAIFERLVRFPLWEDFAEDLQSDVADLKNIGGATGGSITAAKFLQHFTAYPWLHFDIAGVAFLQRAEGYRSKGGNPFGIRLVYHFLKSLAASKSLEA